MLLWTTRVTITRPSNTTTAGPPGGYVEVASFVRANISGEGGSETLMGGSQQTLTGSLTVPRGTDLHRYDRVLDESTGQQWEVTFVVAKHGLGLDRVKAGLQAVEGGVAL
jgi:hypothetical protein